MKDATLYYLNKAIGTLDDTMSSGKDYTIFGSGTQDIVFTKSGSFIDLAAPYSTQNILEFRNVTINEGVSIVGNTFRVPNRTDILSRPFFLKVSGTLTVNGILNMNGGGTQGYPSGSSHSNHDWYYGISYTQLGYTLSALPVRTKSISEKVWQDLYSIGSSKPFFNCQTYLIGAGSSKCYKWKGSGAGTKYKERHQVTTTCLNSGGVTLGGKKTSGGGGGFLALYYENLINDGPTWTENGITYYTNINANGGTTIGVANGDGAPFRYGGGMMVIAAKNIVIGKNGFICCNPSTDSALSTSSSPRFGNSDLNSGGLALMNRPVYGSYLKDFRYGNIQGHDATFSGGPGVCFGYQIIPEYTKVNH